MHNLPLFNNILENPIYYLHSILIDDPTDEINFIKYEYGPYLSNTNILPSAFRYSNYEHDYDLQVMVNISNIIKMIQRNERIFKIKNFITDLLLQIPDGYEYKETLKAKYFDILNGIRETQKEQKLLESAMINYAPIVPYTRTIVKPGVESNDTNITNINLPYVLDAFKTYHTREDIVKNVISKFLIDNIFDILDEYDKCIKLCDSNIEDIDSQNGLLTYNPSEGNGNAELYYLLVYLTYKFDESDYPRVVKYLDDLYNMMINIKSMKSINVSAAIESLSELLPL